MKHIKICTSVKICTCNVATKMLKLPGSYDRYMDRFRVMHNTCYSYVIIWTYGVQLWGTAFNSNIEIIQRFQNKYLRIIVNAPWYVTNDTLYYDLNVSYVRDEIKKLSQRYADRLEEHPNTLTIDLMSDAEIPRRLKRKLS